MSSESSHQDHVLRSLGQGRGHSSNKSMSVLQAGESLHWPSYIHNLRAESRRFYAGWTKNGPFLEVHNSVYSDRKAFPTPKCTALYQE